MAQVHVNLADTRIRIPEAGDGAGSREPARDEVKDSPGPEMAQVHVNLHETRIQQPTRGLSRRFA